MRDELIAYLLDELGPDERRDLERRVQRDATLRQELDLLRTCMGQDGPAATEPGSETEGGCCAASGVGANHASDDPLGDDPQSNDPQGNLSARTMERIRSGAVGLTEGSGALGIVNTPNASCPFTLVDTVVTLGVVMALGMMLLPAMVESREASHRIACQNNLRQLGVACVRYADAHGGYFPHIRPGENAGFFVVRLAQNGGIDAGELERWLVCPSSPIADQVSSCGETGGGRLLQIPSPEQLAAVDCRSRTLIVEALPNSYAYRFGYWQGGRYIAIRKQPGRTAPLLADSPDSGNGFRSINHGGCGQNVLNDDLSVAYWVDSWAPDRDDHLFLNKRNEQAAGYGWNDVVLGANAATPGVTPAAVSISP